MLTPTSDLDLRLTDLEPASARLAQAILTNRPVEQTARLGQIVTG